MADNVREVLIKAADMLEVPGVWGQDREVVDKWGRVVPGRLCAALALEEAAKNADGTCNMAQLVTAHKLIRECLGLAISIPKWNDQPERTAEEVVRTLRAVAEHA